MRKLHKLAIISLIMFVCVVFYILDLSLYASEKNIFHQTHIFSTIPPDTLWTKTYGGALKDQGYDVQQTSDGGYIITGSLGGNATDSQDVYLIRTDAYGFVYWQNEFAGDKAYSVQETSSDNYILVGTKSVAGNGTDVYLLKIEDMGGSSSLAWSQTYGGKQPDAGHAVLQTSDGGYIITGGIDGDVVLMKTNGSGDTTWTQRYGGTYTDCGYSVQCTSDGGYIITGSIAKGDSADVYLIRTDSLGDTLWTKTYGGTCDDYGHAIQQISDGGYIIAGYSNSFNTGMDNDIYLIKTGVNGDSIWTRVIGTEYDDKAHALQQTSDGGYVICGTTASNDSTNDSTDIYLIKIDSLGSTIWECRFGGSRTDCGRALRITSDGGYIITGYTSSFGAGGYDIYLIKTKPVLSIVSPEDSEILQGGSNYMIEWCPENSPDSTYQFCLLFSSDGDSIFTDTIVHGINGTQHAWEWVVPLINSPDCYIKLELLDESGKVISDCVSGNFLITLTGVTEHGEPSRFFSFDLQSNPVRHQAVFDLSMPADAFILLRIYDVTGRFVDTPIRGMRSAGIYEIPWMPDVNSGIYFYSFISPWHNDFGKIVFIR